MGDVRGWGGLGSIGTSTVSRRRSGLPVQPAYQAFCDSQQRGLWSNGSVGPGTDHDVRTLAAAWELLRRHARIDRGGSAGGCMPWPSSDAACWTVRPWNLPLHTTRPLQCAAYACGTSASIQARVAFDQARPDEAHVLLLPEDDGASSDDGCQPGQLPSSRQYFFGDFSWLPPSWRRVWLESHRMPLPPSMTKVPSERWRHFHHRQTPHADWQPWTWLPPGSWFEIHTGRLLGGKSSAASSTRSISVHLFDVPVYAKGGAVIPHRPLDTGKSTVGLSADAYEEIEWTVYPGATSGQATVYEDDGQTYTLRHSPTPSELHALHECPREHHDARERDGILHANSPQATVKVPSPATHFGASECKYYFLVRYVGQEPVL